jgi:hypothetical protein
MPRPANETIAYAGGVERLADVRRFRRTDAPVRPGTPVLSLPHSIQYVVRDARMEAPAPHPSTGRNSRSTITHRPDTSSPLTVSHHTARPAGSHPRQFAIPTGIGWSGASRTPIGPGPGRRSCPRGSATVLSRASKRCTHVPRCRERRTGAPIEPRPSAPAGSRRPRLPGRPGTPRLRPGPAGPLREAAAGRAADPRQRRVPSRAGGPAGDRAGHRPAPCRGEAVPVGRGPGAGQGDRAEAGRASRIARIFLTRAGPSAGLAV